MKDLARKNVVGRLLSSAAVMLTAGLLFSVTASHAQVAGDYDDYGGHGDDSMAEGPVCEPGSRNPQCGGAENRCCVRVKEVRRIKVDGKWRTRVVLGGWRCFTGPNADQMCRRYNRK